MKALVKWLTLFFVVPFFFAACSGSSGGGSSSDAANFSLSLTDAPGDYLNVFVTISGIYVIVDDSAPIRLDFADFDSPAVTEETDGSITVDLLQLANGASIELALGNLPEGELNQIRLIITEASLNAYEDVVGIDGDDPGTDISHVEANYPVKVPSGAQTGIKLNPRDVEIQGGSLTSLTLDFDAGKSIVELGGAGKSKRAYDFILKPVIFILEATGSTPVTPETVATGLNFPTGLEVVEAPGGGAAIAEGDVLVANAGTSGTNADTVLDIDTSGTLPVDATAAPIFASSADVEDGEPLVSNPTGVEQYMELVWISNAASLRDVANTDTVSEIYTSGTFSNLFTDGLVAPSGVEFGGFAPDGSLVDYEDLIFETNGNGSVTGIDLKSGSTFEVLPPGTFTNPSGAAFVPETIAIGNPAGTLLGTLYVVDATTNEMTIVALTVTGGAVGDPSAELSATVIDSFLYTFANEPIGIAYSPGSGRLYMANRGNGTLIALQTDGTEIDAFDTGLGGDAINGIDAINDGTDDIIFLTNTAGNTDPSNDDPSVGMSTLERVVILLP